MKVFDNIMLDIETLGTSSDAVILTIAAIEFDIKTGELGEQFYKKIDIKTCEDAGLKISASTLKWWLSQDYSALKEAFAGECSLYAALADFKAFYKAGNKDTKIWANAPTFDCAILRNAFNAYEIDVPWKYYNERCVRTLASLYPEAKEKLDFTGDKHNALHDCIHQVAYCSLIYKKLKIG